MTAKPSSVDLTSNAATVDRQHKSIEVTALLARRPLSVSELKRVSRALAAEGIKDLQPTRMLLAPGDAEIMREGSPHTVSVAIIPAKRRPASDPTASLSEALAAARARGAALKDTLLADPTMLSTAEMAERLGMSAEGIRLKWKRHQLLGLEFAKRGIRYPEWQLLPDRQLLPALPALFEVLGNDSWRLYRFLLQHHGELGDTRALDALRRGRVDAVLAVAENAATGAFA